MPMSRSQAHEAPLLRITARFPDGQLHQFTLTATWQPTPELARSEDYQRAIGECCRNFMAMAGGELLRVQHVNCVSMEVGG